MKRVREGEREKDTKWAVLLHPNYLPQYHPDEAKLFRNNIRTKVCKMDNIVYSLPKVLKGDLLKYK